MQRLLALQAFAETHPSKKLELLRAALTADPTLIFTGSAATARYLATELRCGLATARDGRSAIDAFQRGAVHILAATDFASEGLNLQRAAVVVHYDIPWNPAKLDQRNGRAYRIGQTRDSVKAIYLLPEMDQTRIVATIAAKNRVRRRVLNKVPVTRNDARTSTLRPRVTAHAAITRFPVPLPESLDRRHKAGVERLIAALSRGRVDDRLMSDLLAIVTAER
jgi:superfamily II DNA/RNA helicase